MKGNETMGTMTQAAYARTRGVSKKTVTKWKERGLVVMAGDLVDVAASDAKLQTYRRRGLPTAESTESPEQLLARLKAMDWTTDFAWTEDAQTKRAQQAAACIGLRIVTSDAPYGDGNWGGFQLRHIKAEREHGLDPLTIWAGYGYELCPIGAIEFCREEVDHNPALVERPELMRALARPLGPGDTKEE